MTLALAELRTEDGTLVAVLGGDWKLGQISPHFNALMTESPANVGTTRALAFDASGLGEWDSSLLVFLLQARDYATAQKLELDRSALPKQIGRLLALSEAVPERSTSDDADTSEAASVVGRLGTAALGLWSTLQGSLTFMGEVALAVRNLSLAPAGAYGVALQEVSLTLRAGEVLGLAGVSGNGQQELLAVLSGEDRHAAVDSVRLFGADIAREGPRARRALGLHFVPEERLGRGAVPMQSLAANTLLTRREPLRALGWIDHGAARDLATRLIERFKVKASGPLAAANSLF